MSHALLLRLFLSPYFSVHVAIQYLKAYPANIGITHYLTNRLRSMPSREVEFYWPELCHLLVTTPTGSVALERFILNRAEESTHSAMLTFWFMQAALCDLAPNRVSNPECFLICQRILLQCHEIIFGDPPPPSRPISRSPYGNGSSPSSSAVGKALASMRNLLVGDKKLVPGHTAAAMVGMGVVLASAPGIDGLVGTVGKVAIEQGRVEIEGQEIPSGKVELEPLEGADGSRGGGEVLEAIVQDALGEGEGSDDDGSGDGSPREEDVWRGKSRIVSNPTSLSRTPPTSSQPTTSSSSSHRDPSATTPSLPIAPHLLRQNTHDPFDQFLPKSSSSRTSPFPNPAANSSAAKSSKTASNPSRSVPSLHSALNNEASSSLRPSDARSSHDAVNSPEALLTLYTPDDQTKLLRSHYCRSEVRFLIALEDISNRLLVIPKPARVSALRAELTSLNHLLPAEVCMPTWCQADHGHEEGGETASGSSLHARPDANARSKSHHRVVRISPGDSVVLNSAERAPYLIHVEVLEGDLDFDPLKRVNRELLKKIVSGEVKKKVSFGGKSLGSDGIAGFGAPMPDAVHPLVGLHSGLPPSTAAATEVPRPHQPPEPYTRTVVKEPLTLEADLEEMDLVEQIYGKDVSAKALDPELEERAPIDLNPKNKDIDRAYWSGTPNGIDTPPSASSSRFPSSTNRTPSYTHSSHSSTPLSSHTQFATNSASPNPSNLPSPTKPRSSTTSNAPRRRNITLDDYSDRMRTAAVMLAQLSASSAHPNPSDPSSSQPQTPSTPSTSSKLSWLPGTGWISGSSSAPSDTPTPPPPPRQVGGGGFGKKLPPAEAEAIREKIMTEMLALEEERVDRMKEKISGDMGMLGGGKSRSMAADGLGGVGAGAAEGKVVEDESIVRRELNKADPSAAVFSESWSAKKARIRAASPWGHLATWDVLSVIVKTGADLRQEQLATQLIERFSRIWKEENCSCWVRYFRILITGDSSGLVETITDSVSVHSIKKAEYGRRMARGETILHVSLFDHFVNVYGEPTSPRFLRAQRNFIQSLAGYSVATYLLQIKDRHNGNILIDREGHCIHIDFGFMLSNSPGNMGFEAAPFKLTLEYVDIMGGVDSPGFALFKKLFKEGFEAARKHSDEIITIVELMQHNSKLDCFTLFGPLTAQHLRDRFQLGWTEKAVDDHLERLIVSSVGSNWTRLYDSFQWYSQSVFQ